MWDVMMNCVGILPLWFLLYVRYRPCIHPYDECDEPQLMLMSSDSIKRASVRSPVIKVPQHPTADAAAGSATFHRQNFLAAGSDPLKISMWGVNRESSAISNLVRKPPPCRQHARAALADLPNSKRRSQRVGGHIISSITAISNPETRF